MTDVTAERPQNGWAKALAAVALVAAAEVLVFDHSLGSVFGGFCLAWAIGVALTNPAILRRRAALVAWACAAGFAVVQIDRPSLLAFLLFGVSLALAALLPLAPRFDDGWRWAQRLFLHGLVSPAAPILDVQAAARRLPPGAAGRWLALAPALLVPLVGAVVFIALFSVANPLIGEVIVRWKLPQFDDPVARLVFGAVVLVAAWATLNPRARRPFIELKGEQGLGLTPVAAAASLAVFNGVFAVQNGLDAVFLWSGAQLPAGVTLADYAHRGAYTLIGTAILAGLFVLAALRPGSASARSPLVRGLLVAWIAQNLFLVASSVLRLVDYIAAYSLTSLRIAALVWMGLVACGLLLIAWRLLRGRSGAWLVNANLLATLVVLAVSSAVDYGALAAAWNVRHAAESGGSGEPLDLCYLGDVGAPALAPLARFEQRVTDPAVKLRAASVRQAILDKLQARQQSGYGWTFRAARRLDRVAALNGGHLPAPPAAPKGCAPEPLAPAAPASTTPLTSNAGR